jgi:UDP-2-acetamido-3-amino-2,3-dideoxy-glucuronate N-acetyltransferase
LTTYNVAIHPTAEVSPKAQIGSGTQIWHFAQIREGAIIGQNCIIGKDVYVDFDVKIGNNVKIQNGALIYHGVTLEDGVFIGPQACLTNDPIPRAITSNGLLKGNDDWVVGTILVKYGASLGAGSVILPNLTLGRFALTGAGAIVTHHVPDHGLVIGNPARLVGYVCHCGRTLEQQGSGWYCTVCDWTFVPEKAHDDLDR